MPELPEVEVIRAGLEPVVTGARIADVDVLDVRSLTRHRPGAPDFAGTLIGRTIFAAARRGKFLWLPLAATAGERQLALLIHLGMSGQVLLREPELPGTGPVRVRILLERNGGEVRMDFADQRTFGSLAVDDLVATKDGRPGGFGSQDPTVPIQVAHIARDPLDEAFEDEAFIRSLATTRSGIKRVLLDQERISGIGNIYADEALWAARMHYDEPACGIGRTRLRRLLENIRLVLEAALADGGTSFDSLYVNVNGASGYFARGLNVYGRAGQPCRRCGRAIVREPFMNRSSFRCPYCQRRRSSPTFPDTRATGTPAHR